VQAQHDLNAEVDAEFERGHLTEQGMRERKAEIQNSAAFRAVDMGEAAVIAREAEARQRYDELIASKVHPDDTAEELRHTRYVGRVEREMAAADTQGGKVAAAHRLLEKASPGELSVLLEELPSMFPGQDSLWIDEKLVHIDPQLGAAGAELKTATHCRQMSDYAAGAVRAGFQSGSSTRKLDVLTPAVARLDPDASCLPSVLSR